MLTYGIGRPPIILRGTDTLCCVGASLDVGLGNDFDRRSKGLRLSRGPHMGIEPVGIAIVAGALARSQFSYFDIYKKICDLPACGSMPEQ